MGGKDIIQFSRIGSSVTNIPKIILFIESFSEPIVKDIVQIIKTVLFMLRKEQS